MDNHRSSNPLNADDELTPRPEGVASFDASDQAYLAKKAGLMFSHQLLSQVWNEADQNTSVDSVALATHGGKRDFEASVESFVVATSELTASLNHCCTVENILGLIWGEFAALGVTRMRYYHLDRSVDDERFVSIECFGHSDLVTSEFRLGQIEHYRSKSPLGTADSFWCNHLGQPTFFVSIVEHVPKLESEDQLMPVYLAGGLPLIPTPSTNCDQILVGEQPSFWVDVPLFVGRQCVGKLSCDVPWAMGDGQVISNVVRMWQIAKIVAPKLEWLYEEDRLRPVREALPEIMACSTESELWEFCTESLPRGFFDCEFASVFTTSVDSLGSNKLILQKTSFGPSQCLEQSGFYRGDALALTAHVARTRVPLRLSDLADRPRLVKQIEGKGLSNTRLAWSNHIPDSYDHSSFLAVPLVGAAGELYGVLRLAQKWLGSNQRRCFTERDEILLKKIVQLGVLPKLLSLRDAANAIDLGLIRTCRSVSLEAAPNKAIRTIGQALQRISPESQRSRKGYLINTLNGDSRTYSCSVLGGGLPAISKGVHPIAGSLFARSMTQPGHVFINDVAESRSALTPRRGEACTSLSCRVVFGTRCYGSLVIKSDRFDLSRAMGNLLELVAMSAADIFARQEVAQLRCLRNYFQSRQSPEDQSVQQKLNGFLRWFSEPERGMEFVSAEDRVRFHDVITATAQRSVYGKEVTITGEDVVLRANRGMLMTILGAAIDLVGRKLQSGNQLVIECKPLGEFFVECSFRIWCDQFQTWSRLSKWQSLTAARVRKAELGLIHWYLLANDLRGALRLRSYKKSAQELVLSIPTPTGKQNMITAKH